MLASGSRLGASWGTPRLNAFGLFRQFSVGSPACDDRCDARCDVKPCKRRHTPASRLFREDLVRRARLYGLAGLSRANGCGGWNRTTKLPVNSRTLYQFNYPTEDLL